MLREDRLGTAQADLRRARDTGRTGGVEVDVVGGITGLILGVLVTTQGRAVVLTWASVGLDLASRCSSAPCRGRAQRGQSSLKWLPRCVRLEDGMPAWAASLTRTRCSCRCGRSLARRAWLARLLGGSTFIVVGVHRPSSPSSRSGAGSSPSSAPLFSPEQDGSDHSPVRRLSTRVMVRKIPRAAAKSPISTFPAGGRSSPTPLIAWITPAIVSSPSMVSLPRRSDTPLRCVARSWGVWWVSRAHAASCRSKYGQAGGPHSDAKGVNRCRRLPLRPRARHPRQALVPAHLRAAASAVLLGVPVANGENPTDIALTCGYGGFGDDC